MIRWGIIGPGAIANAFAREVNNTKNGVLSAVYGRNENKVNEFCKTYNVENYYTNIDEFLNSEKIDAVYIATPHSYHMEYAKKCIKAKKHVLCEKPFSYNYETSKAALDMAKENNIFIMEALWTLFLPVINKAKTWIEEGRIGKIKLITANFGFISEEDINSRLYNPNLAGGALLDVGIYPILFSNYIMDNIPSEINATAKFTRTNVDETDVINLKYEEGALASLTCSICSDTDNTAVIYGEKGKIVIPTFWRAKEAFLHIEDKVEKYIDEYKESGYKYEIEEANNCIINKELESNIASHKVTLELVKIMDEIRGKIGLRYPFE